VIDCRDLGFAWIDWRVCKARTIFGSTLQQTTIGELIKRKNWGLNWNVALETGGWLVGDDIHLSIDLEIVKQPETVPVAAVAA
jgi:hypothetical protein